jgi:ADP-ribose pyrophosphatase
LFLASDLQSAEIAHEAAESIEVHWVEFNQACTRAVQGELNDGKTALGLLRAHALLGGRAGK